MGNRDSGHLRRGLLVLDTHRDHKSRLDAGQPPGLVRRAHDPKAMTRDEDEPLLPYTPSNTGRRARVGYLGFDGVGFNDLWPLFAGVVLSIGVALRLFIGGDADGRHWIGRTLVSLIPVALGFGYLRILVVGRPPHFKGDLWETILSLRLDFTDPPLRSFPLLPRLGLDATDACGPARAGDMLHPRRARGDRAGKP